MRNQLSGRQLNKIVMVDVDAADAYSSEVASQVNWFGSEVAAAGAHLHSLNANRVNFAMALT